MLRSGRAAMGAVILFAGCGTPPAPLIVDAEGIVFLEGKPLYNVEVRFIPVIDHGAEYVAKGVSDKSGRFTLTCKGQPGACAGENRVLVREAMLPARLKSERAQAELAQYLLSLGGRPLPEKYSNVPNNPLVVDVT